MSPNSCVHQCDCSVPILSQWALYFFLQDNDPEEVVEKISAQNHLEPAMREALKKRVQEELEKRRVKRWGTVEISMVFAWLRNIFCKRGSKLVPWHLAWRLQEGQGVSWILLQAPTS